LEPLGPTPAARRSLVAFSRPTLGKAGEDLLALVRAAAPAAAPPPLEHELRGIATLLGPARIRTYVGAQARANQLAQGIAPGAILHLAIPVVLTEAAPLYSLLGFTPTDNADPAAGLIEMAALLTWSLPGEAAVATRVEYGPGSGEGEALVAFSWSLAVGGTPTLVVNRWIAGPADPNLAARFYRATLGPQTPAGRSPRAAESLQKAMKGVLSQPPTRHPYYWAGFMAIGR
jgi:CHAT domain-containing protein